MDAVEQLRSMGYLVRVVEDQVHLKFAGDSLPRAVEVHTLLNRLRERKAEAIQYLLGEMGGVRDGMPSPHETTATTLVPSRPSPALIAAMQHPAYQPGLPMSRQPEAVEEIWARVTFAILGRPEPGKEALG
jgi:hypothetical protein